MKSNAFLTCLCIFLHIHVFSQNLEDFSTANIGSTYSSSSFIGNSSIVWNYINAKGNQKTTQNNNEAICLNKGSNACLYSDTIYEGISQLHFVYEQEYTSNVNAEVYINNTLIATLTTNSEVDITKEFHDSLLFYNEPVVICIKQKNASGGQITIDDIYWETALNKEIPFVIEYIDTVPYISLHFSKEVFEPNILFSNPAAIEAWFFDFDSITVIPSNNYCGELSFTLKSVKDDVQKVISDTTISCFLFKPANTGDLVFSEIMFDPSPTVGLIESEYIELYNNSMCPIKLEELQLGIGSTLISLPNYVIAPHSYVVIGDDYRYNSIENYLLLKNLPSLPNNGCTLFLKKDSTLLTSISYSNNWYNNKFKENGGWSIEKICLNDKSESKENWTASISYKGGTPGYTNTVNQLDKIIENNKISSVEVANDSTLIIHLLQNGYISNSKISGLNIFSINPSINCLNKYEIYTSKLEHKTKYTLQTNVHNFNESFTEQSIQFACTDSLIKTQSVIFNEILFNPLPNEFDVIECKNISDKFYNCADIYLANYSNGELTNITSLCNKFTLWEPNQLLVITEDTTIHSGELFCSDAILLEASIPTLPDDCGTIVILNKWGNIIDSLGYSENWHSPGLLNVEGVSLERISENAKTNSSSNWRSGNSLGCKNNNQENVICKLWYNSSIIECTSQFSIQTVHITYYNFLGVKLFWDSFTTNSSYIEYSLHDEKIHENVFMVQIYLELENQQNFSKIMIVRKSDLK